MVDANPDRAGGPATVDNAAATVTAGDNGGVGSHSVVDIVLIGPVVDHTPAFRNDLVAERHIAEYNGATHNAAHATATGNFAARASHAADAAESAFAVAENAAQNAVFLSHLGTVPFRLHCSSSCYLAAWP